MLRMPREKPSYYFDRKNKPVTYAKVGNTLIFEINPIMNPVLHRYIEKGQKPQQAQVPFLRNLMLEV